jgi:cell division protein FtsW (lipid II flippase)
MMGWFIVGLTAVMHLAVYLAGAEMAFFPSAMGAVRNVLFVALFVIAIGILKKKFNLRSRSHVIYIALLLTSIGLTFQYRISYDIWASSGKSSVAIANKRHFIRDKINILFLRNHPEFKAQYADAPTSPHKTRSLGAQAGEMAATLAKMLLIVGVFVLVVVLQAKGSLNFLQGAYLPLGVLTFVFTVLLGGITAVFGGASHGGNFLGNMTPWEVLKIPLVLTMTGFVITTQHYFQGKIPVGGDRTKFILTLALIYFTPLWIFLLIRDFGQLWIMTFFYAMSFYISTRRARYGFAGFGLIVLAFILVLGVIPLIHGLGMAIWLYNWVWVTSILGTVAIFGGYVVFVRKTRKGSTMKLASVVGGVVAWLFMAYAMPPYMITLFGAGKMSPATIAEDFTELPSGQRVKFLSQARSLSRDLGMLFGVNSNPENVSHLLESTPPEKLRARLDAWELCETFGRGTPPVADVAALLQGWPAEHVKGILRVSPRFRKNLARNLGTTATTDPMMRKMRSITRASLESRLRTMGTWEPPLSLGVLATPLRRITSWWKMWGILAGTEDPSIYDAQGPYWRTLEHLFRGFFGMEAGGFFGQGLGLGNPTFVPKAINDFVYISLSEELGWIGTLVILLLYTALTWTIILVGQRSTNNYWRLVTTNFAILIWAQVFVNVGGVTGFMPLTGIPLPFISRGFFSMLTSFVALGIIVGISHGAESTEKPDEIA